MSKEQWIINDWQIESGLIQARLSTAQESDGKQVSLAVQPPESQEIQLMLEQLSLSALKVDTLLRTAPEVDTHENKRSLSGSKTLSVLNIASFVEDREQLTVAELLGSCTPYLNPEGRTLYDCIEPGLQDEPGMQLLIEESLHRLAEHPLLAWKLAGQQQEQLLEQIWKCWREQMPTSLDTNLNGESEDEDHASLSDEPSLGSLLAEAAAAGTLHQVGEGLTEVQTYLQAADKKWKKAGYPLQVFQPSAKDEMGLPDILAILPEVKTAMDGYQEIRHKTADRIRQRYVAEQRKK